MLTKSVILSVFLALSIDAAEQGFHGQLYRRGTQKSEKLFNLEAQRSPQLWVDHYRDAQGQDAVIERVFFVDDEAVRYEFDDRQRGAMGSVDVDAQGLLLRWEQDGGVRERRVSKPKTLIFGPLYPVLLRSHWDALLAGRSVEATVPVLSAERLMTATLAFRRLARKDRGDGSLAVEMRPANWFVALFFPPIDLHFDPATRRLLNVQGMSLLRERKGGAWVMCEVDLDYRYGK
jgi:hypothetical protein